MAVTVSMSFYASRPVTELARSLLGKVLISNSGGKRTAGVIVETEAYSWTERGCHAFRNRRTPRNEVMFGPGGMAYVYLCYGVHELFNVVTGAEGVAEAVLVRAVEPLEGEDIMKRRRGQLNSQHDLTSGPGKLTKALGISRKHNGISLAGDVVWLEDQGVTYAASSVATSARIGMNFPGSDARLPWRFFVKKNPWVSKV
jgi:DNA-3-methyladenine glycosylase